MSKQTHIFATKRDLESGLRDFESLYPMRYMLCGLFESPQVQQYDSLLLWDKLGVSSCGATVQCEAFLVQSAKYPISIRRVPQRRGGTRFAVDQLENPGSIVFKPGGLFDPATLIAGNIGTASESDASLKLHEGFTKTVTQGFKRIHEYFVGPEALALLDRGGRLVPMGIRSPREYDLKR